jgi:P-type conjugative transfer protein TrbJ
MQAERPEPVTCQILGRKHAQARATLKKEWKMSSNSHLKRAMLLTGLVAGFGVAKPASAMLVFDPITEGATITTAALTGAILIKIKHIDSNIDHMTGTLDAIKGDTGVIVGHQARIDGFTGETAEYTNNISNLTTYNYETSNVSNVTNNYYGDDNGTIPILNNPDFLGNDIETYKDGYAEAQQYQGQMADVDTLQAKAMNASQNLKSANDALVDTLNGQRASLRTESANLHGMASRATSAGMGTNQIMMNNNALAAAQATQMVEMRSLMLAQANAQSAAQQAVADKDARHIASAQSLRAGLNVVNTSPDVASDVQ